MRPKDQATNIILVKHLKSARVNNYQAHIKNHKLYINVTPYTPKELEGGDKEFVAELLPKANSASPTPSAPPTPSTSHKKDSKKDTIENTEGFKKHREISKGREPQEYGDNGRSKEESNNAYDTNQKHNQNWPCYKEQFDFK
ncbi:hypothetical protein JTB14_000986 [Gonioctena quinquepunctata]|nr:hypothetical protein JTB14_000986 [Gonioctena quinquepunctata]